MFRHLKRFSSGRFIPDSTPKAIPVGFQRPPTLAEQVARLVRSHEFSRAVEAQGFESFDEADDFDIPDDPIDPTTPYESDFDHATIAAEEKGVIQPFDRQRAREAADKVEKARKKRLKSKEGTSEDPNISEEVTSED